MSWWDNIERQTIPGALGYLAGKYNLPIIGPGEAQPEQNLPPFEAPQQTTSGREALDNLLRTPLALNDKSLAENRVITDLTSYLTHMRTLAASRGDNPSDINPDTGVPYLHTFKKTDEYGNQQDLRPIYGVAEDGADPVTFESAAYNLLHRGTRRERNTLRDNLNWAGFYTDKPTMGSRVSEEDEEALADALMEAAKNGVDVETYVAGLAEKARERGVPLNQDPSAGPSPANLKAQASDVEAAFDQLSYLNGLRVSDDYKKTVLNKIMAGETTLDAAKQEWRSGVLATAYPAYADQIKAGMNLAEIASPFMQTKATMLGLNPKDMDLFDTDIRGAMNSQMSLADFEQQVRNDPRWQYSDDAAAQAGSYVNELKSIFEI